MKNIYYVLAMYMPYILARININLSPFNNSTPLPSFFATPGKFLIICSQVLVTGYFVIRLTIDGIMYLVAVSATEKADNKNRIRWTLLLGTLAFLGMFLFYYVVGL